MIADQTLQSIIRIDLLGLELNRLGKAMGKGIRYTNGFR